MMQHKGKCILILCSCFIFGASCVFAQSVKAPTVVPGKPDGKKEEKKYNVEDFAYVNGRDTRNPFEPVSLLKAKTSRGISVRTSKEKKAQPEKLDYELEALRLVGVIKSDKGMIAMMEDTQGKGIFFRKGDHLNKNMWVLDISDSNVVLGYKSKGETKKLTIDIPKN